MVIGFWNQGLTKARMVFKKEGYLNSEVKVQGHVAKPP